MARMPVVSCERCGKEFSALRAECPYCGQRRTIGRPEYAVRAPQASRRPRTERVEPVRGERPVRQTPPPRPERVERGERGERPRRRASWQLLFGLLLIAAAIVAVVLMVLTSKAGGSGTYVPSPSPSAALQTIPPRPSPTPSPTPTVNSVKIFFLDNEITAEAGGFTMYVGDAPLTIRARAYPNDKLYNAPFTWYVSDSTKARLTPSEDTQSCEVEPLESAGGYITLTACCYGVEYSVPLYIWSR